MCPYLDPNPDSGSAEEEILLSRDRRHQAPRRRQEPDVPRIIDPHFTVPSQTPRRRNGIQRRSTFTVTSPRSGGRAEGQDGQASQNENNGPSSSRPRLTEPPNILRRWPIFDENGNQTQQTSAFSNSIRRSIRMHLNPLLILLREFINERVPEEAPYPSGISNNVHAVTSIVSYLQLVLMLSERLP